METYLSDEWLGTLADCRMGLDVNGSEIVGRRVFEPDQNLDTVSPWTCQISQVGTTCRSASNAHPGSHHIRRIDAATRRMDCQIWSFK